MSNKRVDLRLANHGPFWLVRPETTKGMRWLREQLPKAVELGGAYVIRLRRKDAVVEKATADGMRIEI